MIFVNTLRIIHEHVRDRKWYTVQRSLAVTDALGLIPISAQVAVMVAADGPRFHSTTATLLSLSGPAHTCVPVGVAVSFVNDVSWKLE